MLIVDDEPNILLSLQFLMKKTGYEVRTAKDGEEALAEIARAAPDLVLLDVMMPKIDGFSVCQRIRANPEWKDMRIIMLTARGRDVEREKGLALGADDYITKPFSTKDAIARVEAVLGRSESGRAMRLRLGKRCMRCQRRSASPVPLAHPGSRTESRPSATRSVPQRRVAQAVADRRPAVRASFLSPFLLGVLLFAPPLLIIFNKATRILGIPTLYLYLFAVWAALIALVALAVERRHRPTISPKPAPRRAGTRSGQAAGRPTDA